MEDILVAFPENVRRGFDALLQSEYSEVTIRQEGADYLIDSPRQWAFWYRLRLKNGSGLPKTREIWQLDPYELKPDGAGFLLTGEVQDFCWEQEQAVELRFSGADGEMGPLALDMTDYANRPWQSLASSGMELLRKERVAPELVNDRERELLPLLRELGMLCGWTEPPEPDAKWEYPQLKARLGPELHPYLEKIERAGESWKKLSKHMDALLNRLNRIEYLPLWQSLRAEIAQTQKGYSRESMLSPELIRKIEEGFHDRGYSGTYPNFVKTGTIAKSRDIKSYRSIHWVRKGTPAVFHIRVAEGPADGITFLCGTELLREGEDSLGFESCLFDAQGRRFLRRESWFAEKETELEQKLTIAAKKAELRKLTRAERPDRKILWPLFWIAFCIGGGFFAVCMVVGMVLIGGLTALIVDGREAMWELLENLPVLRVFLQSMLVCGGGLGSLLLLNWDEE